MLGSSVDLTLRSVHIPTMIIKREVPAATAVHFAVGVDGTVGSFKAFLLCLKVRADNESRLVFVWFLPAAIRRRPC